MKKVILVLLVGIGVICSSLAGSIDWGYGSDLGGSYTEGWLVELIIDVNEDGIGSGSWYYNPNTTARWIDGDDDFASTPITSTLITGGRSGTTYWGSSFNITPSSSPAFSNKVYTVIYDGTSYADASNYQVVDSTPYSLPTDDGPATYSQTSVSGSWTPIVQVPEPASFMLFVVGLATLAIRRRKR